MVLLLVLTLPVAWMGRLRLEQALRGADTIMRRMEGTQ
jgi:hypothetical protein